MDHENEARNIRGSQFFISNYYKHISERIHQSNKNTHQASQEIPEAGSEI